ncbi:MAG TPA: hypothetical protein VGD45_16175 [Steroidobacter sp.]|uniref:hypothetical protein n=1 Tax=Steroidobacter sp. TaxID=1978227 RepID=UPI002ED7F5F9
MNQRCGFHKTEAECFEIAQSSRKGAANTLVISEQRSRVVHARAVEPNVVRLANDARKEMPAIPLYVNKLSQHISIVPPAMHRYLPDEGMTLGKRQLSAETSNVKFHADV